MPKPKNPNEVRAEVENLLKKGPRTTTDIVETLYGANYDSNAYSRTSQIMMRLFKDKKVRKVDKNNRMSPWTWNEGSPKPDVSDIPDAPAKRVYKKNKGASVNVRGNGSANPLAAYLVRDIKTKLAELEAIFNG